MTPLLLQTQATATPALPGAPALDAEQPGDAAQFAQTLDEAKALQEDLDGVVELPVPVPVLVATAVVTPGLAPPMATATATPAATTPATTTGLATAALATKASTEGVGLAGPAALASPSAAASPGWPPPGLSSLFPEQPLFGSAGGDARPTAPSAMSPNTMTSSVVTPTAASPSAVTPRAVSPSTMTPSVVTPTAASPSVVTPSAVTPNGVPSGTAGVEVSGLALIGDSAAPLSPADDVIDLGRLAESTRKSAAPPTAPLMPAGTAMAPAAPIEALAAAMVRSPAALRLPVAEKADAVVLASVEGMGAATGTERGPEGLMGLPSQGAPLPKLDLAQAFPAPVPLPSPRFADEVGARLQWMADQQGGDATLRISPEGLGPVEIRLKLDGERVELGFTATQQDTRQALQDALPKLREMLAQQGLQLGHADVGQQQSQSAKDESTAAAGARREDGDPEGLIAVPAAVVSGLGRSGRGLLDLYA